MRKDEIKTRDKIQSDYLKRMIESYIKKPNLFTLGKIIKYCLTIMRTN